ncbi:unnamed protein product [Clavelina lepadiformis]|uniref:Uncharacterized protein n=1 Tax=Clavelina lepadiformis TaxID=159417 RepID=A0ABP0FCR7_CLALP
MESKSQSDNPSRRKTDNNVPLIGNALASSQYPPAGEIRENKHTITELTLLRNEALMKEEAARDKLKLQEIINTKQVQELRSQVRRLTMDNQRFPRSPSISSKSESRKKDGKNREVRELSKAIDLLKKEKVQLQTKVDNLTNFIQVASSMKEKAIEECREKSQIIYNLRKETKLANQIKDEEIVRRCQVEGELDSLRAYVDYVNRSAGEKMRHKSVQTMTTIPIQQSLKWRSATAFSNPSGEAAASYNAMTRAASVWRIKTMEKKYRQETLNAKQKFSNASKTCLKQHSSSLMCNHPEHEQSTGVEMSLHRHSNPPLQTNQSRLERHSYGGCTELSNEELPSQHPSSVYKNPHPSQYSNKPLPPPPPRANFASDYKVAHKFVQHTTAMGPAAIVYQARTTVDN